MFNIQEVELRAVRSRQALAGFLFRNSEEARVYGIRIQNHPEKIEELEMECKRIEGQCENLSLQNKIIAFTKIQLLKEAVREARKTCFEMNT